MLDEPDNKKGNGKDIHWWGGALSGGSTVPASFATGGTKAAESAILGAIVGDVFGISEFFFPKDDDHKY